MRRLTTYFAAVLIAVNIHGAGRAQTLYWDINNTNAGATDDGGGIANSVTGWGTDNFWSTDSTGASATGAWTDGNTAVFSAGTNATGNSTIVVNGTQTVGGITLE